MSQELARRDETQALESMPESTPTIFGTSDPSAIVERISEISGVLMRAVEQRGLARKYGNSEFPFLHIEAWQFLGSMLGVTARVVWTKPLEDGTGWEAHAEAVNAQGAVLGAADGMCQKTDSFKAQNDHARRAMAQVRARRGALRSVLGFVAALGGLDFADPDGPISKKQRKALWTLASKHGWSDDETHRRAGIAHLSDLTREQAGELYEEWSESLTGEDGGGVGESVGADTSGDASSPVEGSGVEAYGEGVSTPDAMSRGEATGPPDDPSEPASAPEDAPSMGADVDGSEASPLDFTFAQGAFEGRLCSEVARNDYAQLKASFDKGNIALTRREAVQFFLARSEEGGSA